MTSPDAVENDVVVWSVPQDPSKWRKLRVAIKFYLVGITAAINTMIIIIVRIILAPDTGRQSWGLGGHDPQILGRRSWGRKILLNLIMYRKYARKWWLLKKNRIIRPEVAVNEQCLPGNSTFSSLPGKIEIFQKFAWKNRNFLWNCLKKWKFLRNLPGEIKILLTRIHDPTDFKPDWRRWQLPHHSWMAWPWWSLWWWWQRQRWTWSRRRRRV